VGTVEGCWRFGIEVGKQRCWRMGGSEVIISWELRGELVVIHGMRRLAALRNDRATA
jgi:hypothetical protein